MSKNEANVKLAEELYYAQENLYEDEEEDGDGDGAGRGFFEEPGGDARWEDDQAQRNKQLRRKEQEAEEEANRLAKRQRRDLQTSSNSAEPEGAGGGGGGQAERRRVARGASRAGAHSSRETSFEPEPAPVLLTEEVTGSYRQLAGCHTLLRDRLKSLQRRELVEPRKKAEKVKSKNFMKYEPGAKGERETEMHEATIKATMASKKR